VLQLDDGVRLYFAAPLWLHAARFPVERLRDAILAEDTATIATIAAIAERGPSGPERTGGFHYALWRTDEGINVREMSAGSSRFLAAVCRGASALEAMAAAGDAGIAQVLGEEILPASFVRVELPPGA
jgi:hypothetical protein